MKQQRLRASLEDERSGHKTIIASCGHEGWSQFQARDDGPLCMENDASTMVGKAKSKAGK